MPAEPRAPPRPFRLAGIGSPLSAPGIAGVAGVCAMRSSFAKSSCHADAACQLISLLCMVYATDSLVHETFFCECRVQWRLPGAVGGPAPWPGTSPEEAGLDSD